MSFHRSIHLLSTDKTYDVLSTKYLSGTKGTGRGEIHQTYTPPEKTPAGSTHDMEMVEASVSVKFKADVSLTG